MRGYYEILAQQRNTWTEDQRSSQRFRELTRYDCLLSSVPGGRQRVLDVGCGDGYLSWLLACRGHSVTAADLSCARLTKFAEPACEWDIGRIAADAACLPLADGTFDIVVCTEVLEHQPDYRQTLAEARRLLRPGGLLLVTTPHRDRLLTVVCPHCLKSFNRDGHLHSFTRESLAQDLADAGFRVTRVRFIFSKVTNQLQFHLRLPYGWPMRAFDRLLCRLWPHQTLHLLATARGDGA